MEKLNKLNKDTLKVSSFHCKVKNNNAMSYWKVKGYNKVKIFLDWLYADATIYLERKYKLYQIFSEKYKEKDRIYRPDKQKRGM